MTTSHAFYPDKAFTAELRLELRKDCVYYTWRAQDEQDNFMGEVSRLVSLRIVPEGKEPFEFAFAHAVESIRRERSGRNKTFIVESSEWKD